MNSEPGISLQAPTETDNLLPPNKDDTSIIPPFHCKPGYWARRVRSKGAVLVLVWSFLAYISSSIVEVLIQSVVPFRFEALDGVVTAALFLLAGWLADVYFGRYKVIWGSLLLIWLGDVLGTLLLMIHLLHPPGTDALKYISAVAAYICVTTGSSGLIVNAISFGTDQMQGASSEEISAFIHWFAWAAYTGMVSSSVITLNSCCGLRGDETILVSMLFTVVVSSVALCLDFFSRKWLIIEPVSQNPLKTVLSVLKYAATHKHPVRRSAFTYSEDEIPSRINLGKSKYGGPFTTEQVEDVKTFFRLLMISMAVVVFLYPLNLCNSSLDFWIAHFQWLGSLSINEDCYDTLLGIAIFPELVIVLGFPLYELAIYPLARNWIPSSLKRVGISAFGTIIVASIALSVDMVVHSHTNATVHLECMFVSNNTHNLTVDFNSFWVGIPLSIIIGIELFTLIVSLFEFVCAQTPYNMKGLIIGLSFSAIRLAQALTGATLITWIRAWLQPPTYPTCAFWFYLFVILVTVVSLVMFCIVAKRYKKRERNELLHEQRFVEDFYNKYIQ